MKNLEYYFNFKKYDIFAQSWMPSNHPSEHLLIIHGLGEHSSSYSNMAERFTESQIACHSFDLIGHGKTSGQRGYIPEFQLFVDELLFVLEKIKEQHKTQKISIFAHSMGGLISLKALSDGLYDDKTKLIFSNPLVGINVDIPNWKISLANNVAHILPRISLDNEINDSDLTKDPDVIIAYGKDPLRHRKITAKLFIDLVENTAELNSKIDKIVNPTLFLLSPNDKVCNAHATQELIKKFINAKLELFPQSGHEIINDFSKGRAFDNIIEFIRGN